MINRDKLEKDLRDLARSINPSKDLLGHVLDKIHYLYPPVTEKYVSRYNWWIPNRFAFPLAFALFAFAIISSRAPFDVDREVLVMQIDSTSVGDEIASLDLEESQINNELVISLM